MKEWQPERTTLTGTSSMPETKQFRVTIPRAANRPIVDSLAEAMTVRDQMLQSSHFSVHKRYEPQKQYATYVDPNLETRTY